jgi:molecular chaperone HtpG
LPELDRTVRVLPLAAADLAARLQAPDEATTGPLARFLATAGEALRPVGCEVVTRLFDPPTVPALYLVSSAALWAEELRSARTSAGDLWSGVLDTLAEVDETEHPWLILNLRNPVVRQLTGADRPELVVFGVQALYGRALLAGHHPLRAADNSILDQSFQGLLSLAIRAGRAG